MVELLRPIREKTEDLLKNKDYLESVYREGANKASYMARKTLDKVYRKVGFVKRYMHFWYRIFLCQIC